MNLGEFISYDILVIITLGISLLLLIVIIFSFRLAFRLKKLVRGNSKNSIEDALKTIEEDLVFLQQFKGETENYLRTVEKRLRKSIRGVSNVHFSAFDGLNSGGNQSFATTLLNEEGSGFVLSTLHSRDRVNVFSKPIKDFESKLQLTKEEQEALTRAIESCKV